MVLLLVCALMGIVRPATAMPHLNPACPLNFFTNVASRLLSSQLKINLNHIQIYPTNQYTPAVHRLLQVTANILDATTTNYYPSVFRPLFWKTNEECGGVWQTNIYVAGYQYVQEPLSHAGSQIFSTPMDVSDSRIPCGLSGITNNIYGIPWVLGVKKGMPNFNDLELDNCFFIERLLQFNRNSSEPAPSGEPFPYGRTYTTNQMYVIGVSNLISVEDWNSYAGSYSSQVTVFVHDSLSLALTNDAGVSIQNCFSTNVFDTLNSWSGALFILPFGTNMAVAQNLGYSPPPPATNNLYVYDYSPTPVTLGGYTFTGPCFIPLALNPPNSINTGTPPLPQFWMVATNWLQAYIIDSNNCILDYVQLGGMTGRLDVNSAIADPDGAGFWSTNTFDFGSTSVGVVSQFNASSAGGAIAAEDEDGGYWTSVPVPGTDGNSGPSVQRAFFSAFFSPLDLAYDPDIPAFVTNLNLSILAPFTPTRLVVQRFVYSANDPLVHYLASDLSDLPDDTNGIVNQNSGSPILKSIGRLSDRYMPWGIEGNLASEPVADHNPYNLAYKDPLANDSDAWDFPTNQMLNASWLGRVHRGTPWQTIYLKSTNVLNLWSQPAPLPTGLYTWVYWTGDTNLADAISMAPVQDWAMASLLASLFNKNCESSLFSVNDPSAQDWQNRLNGMTVMTNDINDFVLMFDRTPQFAYLTISSGSSQTAQIASAIDSTRAALPGQVFSTPGNIFAVPQLSVDSPYLNLDSAQINDGISDLAYEAIPDQLLPLLRVDSIGSMMRINGQVIIQFTGDDNHVYAVQVSPNLVKWTTIGTNRPVNGILTLTNSVTANAEFYRTILVW